MSTKFPKPWFRPARGVWYVTIDGKQYNLGADKAAAHDEYHRLMAMPHEQRLGGDSVGELLDSFLEWCRLHRSAATFGWYQSHAQQFLSFLPRGLSVDQVRTLHLQRWLDSHQTWSSGGKRNASRAILRVFNWAVRQGYIDRSPFLNFEKPPAGRRTQIITDQEYAAILANTRDEPFRDLLRVTWETGARPQEVLRVERRHVDLANSRWIFPQEEAKGGRQPRVIYLNDTARSITARLAQQFESGPIFRNTKRKAWTTDAVNCRFFTLQQKLGVRYCLYVMRHTWATNALRKGVDPITVSVLMGHSDTNMLARTYAHLTHDPKYLQQAASRVTA